MKLWLLLALAFIIQEPVSSSAVLLEAYQSHYNVWLIHLVFSLATILDILVCYGVGYFLHKKFKTVKFFSYLKVRFEALSAFIGKKGKILTLILFVPIIFPLTIVFLPWLEITLVEALIYTFIGEWVFWYTYEWMLVLGVKFFTQNSHIGLYVVILVSLVISLGTKFVFQEIDKRNLKQ